MSGLALISVFACDRVLFSDIIIYDKQSKQNKSNNNYNMENKGKNICEQLKKIRHQIAAENGIAMAEHECHFEGECKGTCPRCDGELHYLEQEMVRKGKLSKAALIAGMTFSLAACCTPLEGEVAYPDTLGEGVPEDTTLSVQNETAPSVDEAASFNF